MASYIPMISDSARKANQERRANIHCYMKSGVQLRHPNEPRFVVGFRHPRTGKWGTRKFLTEELAKQFLTKYQQSNTEERLSLIQAGKDHLIELNREKARVNFAAYLEKRRSRRSFIRVRARNNKIYYEAFVRTLAGRWRCKSFHTEDEAKKWINVCRSALEKHTKIVTRKERLVKREIDAAQSVAEFEDTAYKNRSSVAWRPRKLLVKPTVVLEAVEINLG